MAQILTLISMLALLTLGLDAALPKNPSMGEYSKLLVRSPFQIKKPDVKAPEKIINNSLTLRGVSMFDDGWFVTVVDRKTPTERIFLREGAPANSKGIRLVKVDKNADDYLKTTVVVTTGGRQMTIGYNSADIKNSIAKASKVTSKPSTRPGTTNRPPIPSATKKPPVPTSGTSGRRPRVRRTPPVPRTK